MSSVTIGPHWPSSYPEYLSPHQDKDKQRRVVWARLLSQHSNLAGRLSEMKARYLALRQELNPRTTQVESSHDPLYRDNLHWVCGRYVPTSSPFVPSALTLPLVSAPPLLCTHPLLFSPLVCHVHRGLLPIPHAPKEGVHCQTVFTRTLPFLLRYSALHAPPTHPVCPRTPCPCSSVPIVELVFHMESPIRKGS